MRLSLAVLALLLPPLAQAADLKVIDSIKGADGPWDYATVDAPANRLLVGRGDGVMAVDLATGAVTAILVPGKRVHGVVGLPGGLAASANGDSNEVTLFKAADGTVIASIPVGQKPDAVALDPKTGLLAVMNGKDGSVSLIDLDKKAVVATIAVGGKLEFAAADGSGKMFVNVEDKGELVALDLVGRKVAARYPLPGCEEPTGLAIDAANHVLVSACANGKAVATSSVDGHVVATLAIGSHPDAVIFDQKNKRFLVPCGEGVLSVISAEGDHLATAGVIQTARGARTGALDPATGKVYLPTADFEPARQGERAAMIPGTFRLLVLGQN
jgi:DNA-binding beta-propeller fold protein YncE